MKFKLLLVLFMVIFSSTSHAQILDDFLDLLEDLSDQASDDFATYPRTLLAKANPDECYFGVGNVSNTFNPAGIDCETCYGAGGIPKVNQAYVWGMTPTNEKLFYGTGPNVNCLVTGAFLGMTGPTEAGSYVCEYGASVFPSGLPAPIADWRPAKFYRYDLAFHFDSEYERNVDITPAHPLVNATLGIRSAGATDDIVILAGPTFSGGIALFFYDAVTDAFLGATPLAQYNNIRKWIFHDGVLYAALSKTAGGGAVAKWTGVMGAPFEEVGDLDGQGAEIEFHEGRFYVTTWPNTIGGGIDPFGPAQFASLYRSPVIPGGGLTAAHAPSWAKIWEATDYEPDSLIARTYGGGSIASFEGQLYWGTMHVPFLATGAHFAVNGDDINDTQDALFGVLGTTRAATIFRGDNMDTAPTIELLYGSPLLPAYDTTNMEWNIVPNKMGGQFPLYGPPGFGNLFNNYTWAMEVYDDQLFVGTMDHSYLLFGDLANNLPPAPMDLPFDCSDLLGPGSMMLCDEIEEAYDILRETFTANSFFGADLWRFADGDTPAVPESFSGLGNHLSYGVRTLVANDDNLFLGMANPMNLETDCGGAPLRAGPIAGGWELIMLGAPLPVPTMSQWGLIILFFLLSIAGVIAYRKISMRKRETA